MISALGLIVLFTLMGVDGAGLPTAADVRAAWRPSDAVLLDRHGEVLHEIRVDAHRRRLAWTPLADVSPALRDAVVAAEDRRFFLHQGVDWLALGTAALRPVLGGPRRGASTVTMQVAALVDPSLGREGGARSVAQKWRQVRRALALERAWSKGDILEAYLNLVTFRGELTGVRAAAAVLFGKAPHGLTTAEAATIAALVRAPNASRAVVARRAARLAAATAGAAEVDDAVGRAIAAPRGTGPRVAAAPHVAARLLGAARASGRLTVATTLDAGVQRATLDVLRRQVLAVRERHVQDAAALVVDNATGDVLAYVGSGGDVASARWVDGVRARRQPGSALKPFLYALAFEERLLTPASLLDDAPLELPTALGLYRPHNYDDRFRGPVTARVALAASLNVPAVRVLGLVGQDAFAERLRALGFEGVREPGDFYGPALALGSADVTLWELAGAYRALATGGLWRPLRLEADAAAGPARRAFGAEAAFLVAGVLADRESRSVTFGFENALATPFWTAVKTGTSKDMRDNWCAGFSSRYTVAVWVGNFSGEPMHDVSGVTGAAPAWLEIMTLLRARAPSAPPQPPPGVRWASTGGAGAPSEWFIEGTEPVAGGPTAMAPMPRIVWPVAGTVIALDPDIPAPRQRVSFEARGGHDLGWRLDGEALGAATTRLMWAPRPGRHRLELVGDDAQVRDTVAFEVRGGLSR